MKKENAEKNRTNAMHWQQFGYVLFLDRLGPSFFGSSCVYRYRSILDVEWF